MNENHTVETTKTGAMKSFKDLIVWQKAHELVLNVYRFTRRFPKEENQCLTSQFRKSATSIASHIAEGFASPSSGKRCNS